MVKFKEFALGDLFKFSSIRQAKSQRYIPLDKSVNGIPYIVQSQSNNMYSKSVKEQWLISNHNQIVDGNRIVLGVTLPAVSYQPHRFAGSQLITMFSDFMNEFIGLYLVSCISKQMYQFSYSKKPGIKVYRAMKVLLPVDTQGQPDWHYMTEYIQQIEAKYVQQTAQQYQQTVQTYQQVIQPDVLSESETENVLKQYQNADFNKFRVGSLFELDTTNAYHDSKEDLMYSKGLTPFISNNTLNNGIAGYVDYDSNNDGNVITYSDTTNGGDTFFYQKNDFVGYSHVKKMQLVQQKLNRFLAMYFISAIKKSVDGQFNWGTKLNNDALNNVQITLPTTASGEPDFTLMSNYIKVIQQRYVDKLQSDLSHRLSVYQSLI